MLNETARVVREALQADMSKILELRSDGKLLVHAGSGWPDGVVGELELPADGDSQAHHALRSGKPVIVTDLAAEQRFNPSPVFLDLGVRSGVNVVIEQSPHPFGILEVDHIEPREYDADDVEFLQAVANILSGAITRNQLEVERDHLLEVAAHELRNPLAVVLGYSKRLARQEARDAGPDAPRTRELREIYDSALRLQRMLDALLELGRLDQPHPYTEEGVPLLALLREAMTQAQAQHPAVEFEWRLPPEYEVGLNTDPELARVIIGNLVENAAKYSHDPATVTLTLQQDDAGVRLGIRDTCGGIRGRELDRLFDRYFRAQSRQEIRGFGIGLFVANRAAEALRWRIEVQNFPGEGCEFVVIVPLEQLTRPQESP